jgi:hypothetical protein
MNRLIIIALGLFVPVLYTIIMFIEGGLLGIGMYFMYLFAAGWNFIALYIILTKMIDFKK